MTAQEKEELEMGGELGIKEFDEGATKSRPDGCQGGWCDKPENQCDCSTKIGISCCDSGELTKDFCGCCDECAKVVCQNCQCYGETIDIEPKTWLFQPLNETALSNTA